MAKDLLISTTAPSGLFFRLGRAWTKAGVPVARDAFTDEEWAVLQAEPMLHIGPAPSASEDAATAEDDLRARVRVAIAGLAEADFEAGAPKLDALRAALPDVRRGLTARLVAEVWDALKASAPS